MQVRIFLLGRQIFSFTASQHFNDLTPSHIVPASLETIQNPKHLIGQIFIAVASRVLADNTHLIAVISIKDLTKVHLLEYSLADDIILAEVNHSIEIAQT
jgi:hypothetical protein